MNKKERRLALKSAFAYKFINKELIGVDTMDLANAKTKDMVSALANLKIDGKVLIAINDKKENAILAARNIKGVEIMEVSKISVLDITKYKYLVMEEDAIKKLEEVLV